MLFSPGKTRHRGVQLAVGDCDESSDSPSSSNASKKGVASIAGKRKLSIRIDLAVILVALSASIATLTTAIGAAYVIARRQHEPRTYFISDLGNDQRIFRLVGSTGTTTSHRSESNDEKSQSPKVAWLMSFPNSGTSFTIHVTREASNSTTATNYGLEGDIRDQPSVPAIEGSENGPYLERIPDRFTRTPKYILTKTHCGGFCAACQPLNYMETPRSFQVSCQSGRRAVMTKGGLKLVSVTYDADLVDRAVHIIRHPLDNIVARFHLEFNRYKRMGNKIWIEDHPYNETGFQKWCSSIDSNTELMETRWVDEALAKSLSDVPCHAEFFRYIQWHNMASTVSRDMGIPTHIIHYNDYRDDYNGTLSRLLNFLELPKVGNGIPFSSGKEYKDYYTQKQRTAVQSLIMELATSETRKELARYSFS